jgi:hypothetical protein
VSPPPEQEEPSPAPEEEETAPAPEQEEPAPEPSPDGLDSGDLIFSDSPPPPPPKPAVTVPPADARVASSSSDVSLEINDDPSPENSTLSAVVDLDEDVVVDADDVKSPPGDGLPEYSVVELDEDEAGVVKPPLGGEKSTTTISDDRSSDVAVADVDEDVAIAPDSPSAWEDISIEIDEEPVVLTPPSRARVQLPLSEEDGFASDDIADTAPASPEPLPLAAADPRAVPKASGDLDSESSMAMTQALAPPRPMRLIERPSPAPAPAPAPVPVPKPAPAAAPAPKPAAPLKPPTEAGRFMRSLLPPEVYLEKRQLKADERFYDPIDIPPGTKVLWKFQNTQQVILDLMNEEFDTRDLADCEYDDFFEDIEAVYDQRRKITFQDMQVCPPKMRQKELEEMERQQVEIVLAAADALLKEQLEGVLLRS